MLVVGGCVCVFLCVSGVFSAAISRLSAARPSVFAALRGC
jgi:hypothetical protein